MNFDFERSLYHVRFVSDLEGDLIAVPSNDRDVCNMMKDFGFPSPDKAKLMRAFINFPGDLEAYGSTEPNEKAEEKCIKPNDEAVKLLSQKLDDLERKMAGFEQRTVDVLDKMSTQNFVS